MHDRYQKMSDAALVGLAREGERHAFSALLERHYASVGRLCRRLLGPTLEAQDVAQEAALSAFLTLDRLHDPGRFGAWLHAIAANLARMALRRRRPISLDALDEQAALFTIWRPGPPTPEEVVASRELHDTIIGALNELSLLNREAVIGFYLEGYSYAELAALLGVPISTLKGRLFFGRRQLRASLRAAGVADFRPAMIETKRKGLMVSEEIKPSMIELGIDAVQVGSTTQHHVVVLREREGARCLPIWIGPPEAAAIMVALEGQQMPRPMTHDLAARLVETLGYTIEQVAITQIVDSTFFAEIALVSGAQRHVLDARPSDALALAVRVGAPIFAAQAVLEQAGVAYGEEVADLPGQEGTKIGVQIVAADPARDQMQRLLDLAEDIALISDAPTQEQLSAIGPLGRLVTIIDVDMPDRDGFALADQLLAANEMMRVVLIGSAADMATLRRAMQAGAREYLPKPVAAEELLRAIRGAPAEHMER
jgi:uncharacterized protein